MSLLLHVDLLVTRMDEMISFYVDLLGAEVAEDTIVDGAAASFYSNGRARAMRLVMLSFTTREPSFGALLELLELATPIDQEDRAQPRGRSGACNFALVVTDLDELLAELAAAGVATVTSTMTIELPRLGTSRVAFIRDPEHNLVELVERQRRPDA